MRRSCSPGGTTLAAAAVVLDSVCPVKTSQRISPEEVLNDKHPDIRSVSVRAMCNQDLTHSDRDHPGTVPLCSGLLNRMSSIQVQA